MTKKIVDFFSKKEVIIFLISFLIIIIFARTETLSSGEASRIATMESLVERGTFIIDDSNFNWTKDKMYIDCDLYPIKGCGHYYSEKPPVLSFIGAGLYFILFKVFGITLYESYGYYLLTLLIIGISYSLLLVFFYKSLCFIKIKEKFRILATLGLGVGTLVLPFSVVFYNHAVSASLLFISFYILLKLKFSKNTNIKINMFLIGLLISLATIVEYSCAVFLILFFIYILSTKKLRHFTLYFILGLIGPLTLHFILNYMITGSLKPAYLLGRVFNYEGSPWPEINADWQKKGKLMNLSDILIREQGLFSLNPILIIPFLYLIITLFDKNSILRKESWMIFLGICIIFYVYVTKFRYGGARFSIILMPLIMFYAPIFFKKNKSQIILAIYYIYFYISFIITVKILWLRNIVVLDINKNIIIYYIFIFVIFYISVMLITKINKKLKEIKKSRSIKK